MKHFKPEEFVDICEHCGKVIGKNEERYIISTQKWSKNAAENDSIVLINSTVLCSKCYL